MGLTIQFPGAVAIEWGRNLEDKKLGSRYIIGAADLPSFMRLATAGVTR
jgi:hypothetical protein